MISKWASNILGILFLLFFAFSMFQASWIAPASKQKLKLVAGLPVDLLRNSNGCIQQTEWSRGDTTSMLQTAVGAKADAVSIDSDLVGKQILLKRYFEDKCPSDSSIPRSTMQQAANGLTKPDQFIRVNNPEHAKAMQSVNFRKEQTRIFFANTKEELGVLSKEPSFSIDKAQQCVSDYRLSGIWGDVPETCKNGTALIGLDDIGYTLWGWPNRFLSRMEEANVRVIVAADVNGGQIRGLTELDQYSDIEITYRGYVWIDNIEDMGPALIR